MRRIFLSYRRKDSAGETGRLADRLTLELGTLAFSWTSTAFRLNRLRRAVEG
jgi:hypothetical protein